MGSLRIPENLTLTIDGHKKWLEILDRAQKVVEEDLTVQKASAKGLRMKERTLPPEVIGRSYAQYCQLINKMYDAYLTSEQLQRSREILEIITILVKRMYELRNELVHIIVNDYIYVDSALAQLAMTPSDIQIVIPYHFPLESRKDSVEQVLQKMWKDAYRRKNKPPKKEPVVRSQVFDEEPEPRPVEEAEPEEESEEEESIEESEHTVISEDFIQMNLIQRHERFRQWFLKDFKMKCTKRKIYFAPKVEESPETLKHIASKLIQRVYREYMRRKREMLREIKRDVLLGIRPDPFKRPLNFRDESDKLHAIRRKTRMKMEKYYQEMMEKENERLIFINRDNQLDDITEQIREWFKEWYYDYGFFPQYPYEIEGGTLLVIREDFPSVEEQIIADEKLAAATKGKTKDQLQQEKEQAEADRQMRAELEKEKMEKEAENLFKARCNPQADPGYKAEASTTPNDLVDVLHRYRATWSVYDEIQPDRFGEVVYGFIKPLLTEELMCQLHKDCRAYVDELMRLDLKLLIKAHQLMYKRLGWKYPKTKPRPRPRAPSPPKRVEITDTLLKHLEIVFDLGIVTKPTAKISDIDGDNNYAAYELNIADPDVRFPPPGYGDIRRRLVLSCVLGSGMQQGATRNKTVMLLGPGRNGKSFLVDAVAGEMNAIKIDISPEVFSAVLPRPARTLSLVMAAAKAFQPAVIFMRNVERVFYKKTPPEDKKLRANKLKTVLGKCLKQISTEDKIIFIATCTNPFAAKQKPLVNLFNEIILVPRTDYGTLQRFFSEKLQGIRSMPQDMCVQPIAQLLQGYGYGIIREAYDAVLTSERILRLNIDPFSPSEFLEVLLERNYEPVTLQEYELYTNFYIQNSPLSTEREQYAIINRTRAAVYEKLAKKEAEKEAKG